MLKKIFIVLFILFIAGLAGFSLLYDFVKPATTNPITEVRSPVNVTPENFASYIQNQQIVRDLPSEALLLLRFYDFKDGERVWNYSYIIKKDSVVEGEVENPDITIVMASKYLKEVGKGLCSTVQRAQDSGDFYSETGLSTSKLMWKYRSMTDYRSCLGL